jgi:hypothetical protein
MKYFLFTLFLIFCGFNLSAQTIKISVTQNNLGLVNEQRTLDLKEGTYLHNIADLPDQLDPTSVFFNSEKGNFKILEQNFEYDVLNADKLLAKYVGKAISLTHKDWGVLHGILLNFDGSNLIIKLNERDMRIIPRGKELQIILEDAQALTKQLLTEPTLVCIIQSEENAKTITNITYLTKGLSWKAEYNAVLNEDETGVELASSVTVNNTSGKNYNNTMLKLIAGDINRVRDRLVRPTLSRMQVQAAAEASFAEEDLFEYHMYTLSRPTSLNNNQSKMIQLIPTAEAKIQKLFSYNYQKDREKVTVQIIANNDKKNGLGIPLPQGRVRIYKKHGADLELIGEAQIKHIAKNEQIKLEVGKAFDIAANRTILERKKLAQTSEHLKIEVTLRNHKDENVQILVTEPILSNRTYELLNSNFPVRNKDAKQIEFLIPVESQGVVNLQYEIRYSW